MAQAQTLTYDSLITDVISYAERNDTAFVNQIPRFIMMAENDIIANVKNLLELTVVRTTLLPNTPFINKPAFWRKNVSLTLNSIPLKERSQEYIDFVRSQFGLAMPQFYSDYDYNNVSFAPLPDQSYELEWIYYQRTTPLSETNIENLYTREAPQVLVFGTLFQAASWLKAPDKLQMWQGLYQAALQALQAEDSTRIVDRNTVIAPS